MLFQRLCRTCSHAGSLVASAQARDNSGKWGQEGTKFDQMPWSFLEQRETWRWSDAATWWSRYRSGKIGLEPRKPSSQGTREYSDSRGIDRESFDRLSLLLRYVDCDYADPSTFAAIRKESGAVERPAHYLAEGQAVQMLASRWPCPEELEANEVRNYGNTEQFA
jgi:hypothetical protein